ncbi:MAG: DNA primase [Gammaproteobacteria bacterium]
MSANFIPKSFIESLVAAINIVDLIGSRVELKKAGKDHKGLCPFHNEKTPSFIVSETKGFYHCFGCGAHGTPISFLMEHDNLDFVTAIKYLAEKVGMEVPLNDSTNVKKENEQAALLEEITKIYESQLNQSSEVKQYLTRRGINEKSIKKFRIGYSPDSWNFLSSPKLLKRFSEKKLFDAGLIVKNEKGNIYDRFRGRIIFPIKSSSNKIIAFGGRNIDEQLPKYINSPETITFNKSHCLYGLSETYEARNKNAAMFLCEGYLDVISLAQIGIMPSVATLGTALTESHVKQIIQRTPKVVFCFDGDEAGKKASLRTVDIVLGFAGGLTEFSFLFLPKGQDPDSIVQAKGKDHFLELAKKSIPLSELMIKIACSEMKNNNAESKSKAISMALTYIQKMRNQLYKDAFITDLADHLKIDKDLIINASNSDTNTFKAMPDKGHSKRSENLFIREAISILVQFPKLANKEIPLDALSKIQAPGTSLLVMVLRYIRTADSDITTSMIIEHFRDDDLGKHISKLVSDYVFDDEPIAEKILEDIIKKLSFHGSRSSLAESLAKKFKKQ